MARRGFVLMLVAVVLSGCQLPTSREPDTLKVHHQPKKAPPKELPPDQVAELCWAAGEELQKRGYEREAIVQYEKVRQIEPDRPGLAWRLAVLHDRQGNVVAAREAYQAALQEQPDNPHLLNDRGYFSYQLGEWKQAEVWYRKALKYNPQHQRATVNLGLVLAKQKQYDQALECFVQVLPRGQALCNVAIIQARQGQIEQAQKNFRLALEEDPELLKARQLLTWLNEQRPASARDQAVVPAEGTTTQPEKAAGKSEAHLPQAIPQQ